MKIRIRGIRLYDQVVLALMYLQLTIFGFMNLWSTCNKILAVLILIRIIMQKKHIKSVAKAFVGLLMLYICSTLFGESRNLGNAKSTFLMLLYPMLYFYYVAYLCLNEPSLIDEILDKAFWLFNLTILVNMAVLCMQILRPNFIVAKADYTISFSPDTVSGLFVYGGTHELCLFSIFILLYNYTAAQQLEKKKKKKLVNYTIALSILLGAISMCNDNKMYFVILPLAVIVYMVCCVKFERRKIRSAIRILVVLAGIIFGGYLVIPSIKSQINQVIDLVHKSTVAFMTPTVALGGNERTAIISYALRQRSTWLFGMGFGSATLYEEGFCGFAHFGLSDFGSILLLGGICFYAVLHFAYVRMQKWMIHETVVQRRTTIALSLFLICVEIYTVCYSRTSIATILILITLTVRMRLKIEASRMELLSEDVEKGNA